jgi:hypothetical protein
MAESPELRSHREWIGYVQPAGVVVSPPALLQAGAQVDRNIHAEQRRLLECVEWRTLDGAPNPVPVIADLRDTFVKVFGWEPDDLRGPGRLPPELDVNLTEYDEALRPEYAVPDPEPADGAPAWLMLVDEVPPGTDLDAKPAQPGRNWDASPTARLERLLRETQVPVGLLSNGTHLRLMYAPRGETSGHMTFPVSALIEVAGRPILAGLYMLLRAERLFSLPAKRRLPAILEDSRRYQAQVSTALARQVLAGLYELLRGFQAADDHARGALLADVLRDEGDRVYEGLLTVLMRLVFLLYAEDRGIMPADPVYLEHYSVGGLFDRLREDAAAHPDTMDLRYGAWARLLVLFRLVHDGAAHGAFRLPPRHGYLFNPDRYPFLEGRPWREARVMGERVEPPLVPDGVVYRVLEKLLVLDGERLSYRTLDVEQIGSVYETMMGFTLETARGRSIAVRPAKAHGAPVTLDLDALLAQPPAQRAKWLREQTDQNVSGAALDALKSATTPEDAVAALGSKVDRAATPNLVPRGAMVLQPSDERRRSGTHYTPRSLTAPIVTTTLRPVLAALGDRPTPAQILDLKVLDPAMGSGAFLVEACRQLGEALVRAWHAHEVVPRIPSDEDELLHAMRQVAQRCLYGVDRNPIAADLGKLSLWLATLARDHAFTFIDHAIRHGDSLVGLTRAQIAAFHWAPPAQLAFAEQFVAGRIAQARELRAEVRDAADDALEKWLRVTLEEADDALEDVRLAGDLAVAAFFGAEKPRDRERLRVALEERVRAWLDDRSGDAELRAEATALREERGVAPFHWQVEFPEVFDRTNPGFDATIGNPPFLGGRKISTTHGITYADWLRDYYEGCGNTCDLAAYFFRRCFFLLRDHGVIGLVATNTIAQGDTRAGGLAWILKHGGEVLAAQRRLPWPGNASVVVSVVHITKGLLLFPKILDNRPVDRISAFLFHQGGDSDPQRIAANASLYSQGSKIYGQGFLFDDDDAEGTPVSELLRIRREHPECAARILPYVGGEDVNADPLHKPRRYVICLSDVASESELGRWRPLADIVRAKVKPYRDSLGPNPVNKPLKRRWWAFQAHRPDFYEQISHLNRVLVLCRVSQHFALTFLPTNVIYAESLIVFALDKHCQLAMLQSRAHEVWARFFTSTLGDALRYAPSDCFETFPFPEGFETSASLEAAGREYHEFRAALMFRNDEGLTKTYNRFHDPDETSPDIRRLRELHDAMDRAVLDAYGWTDLRPTCEFLLDYEEDEDEAEEGGVRRRRKPWRYRWPDDLRDEVLARLLALNAERARAERLAGPASPSNDPARRKRR